jgi:hypothetical protein
MAWSLEALNYYTRTLPDEKRTISLDRKLDIGLFEELSPNLQKSGFTPSDKIEFRIKTAIPLRGGPFGENIDLPTGGTPAFTDVTVPLREVMDVATITKQALERATGMPGSWGSAVDDAQNDMVNTSFKELLQYCAVGNGSGFLGKIHSAVACSDAAGTEGAGNYIKFYLDNDYATCGFDGAHLCQVGMSVEVADSTGATYTVTDWSTCGGHDLARLVITNIVRKPRQNQAFTAVDNTDADYIICACYSTAGALTSSATLQGGVSDGDLLYRYGSISLGIDTTYYTPFPRGLFYFLNGGHNGAGAQLLTAQCGSSSTAIYTAYCGKTRLSYPSLMARIYQGGQSGYLSGSGTAGTPETWDLSDVTDAMIAIEEGTGKGKVNLLMMNKQMGLCLGRKTKTENSTIVMVGNTSAANAQAVALPRIPKTIEGPDGQPVKVIINKMWPNNSIGMFDTRDIVLAQKGSFDYLNLYGGAWGPTKNDRKANFEAFYGGMMQMYAYRLDNMALMQDLADNIS